MIRASIAFFVFALTAYIWSVNSVDESAMKIGTPMLFAFIFLSLVGFTTSYLIERRSRGPICFVIALALLSILTTSPSTLAEETISEKIEDSTNKISDKVKSSYRNTQSEVCTMMNGQMECTLKKVKNKFSNMRDKSLTKVREEKNKAD